MLNKISLRRIKSFLSLRGAKRRSNLNFSGFSLIELMVAIAILAMAIFGIFHAYSVGFMGMADARARTVATNYAREAMEDIKNKDFDQIITQSRALISGTKFEREIIVQKSTNLKKITTNVYWYDRNGNPKMVDTDMAVHFIETTADDPIKIILYANPYNVLTDDDTNTSDISENKSIITAVIKDAKGNTVTTPDYNITFSITQTSGDTNGSLFSDNGTTVNGKATTTFTSSGGAGGEFTITATVTGLTSDSVKITATSIDKPVKIDLSTNPMFMTPGSTSIITATIVNAVGGTVTTATNEITFSVSGPGTLSNQSVLESGVATIDLISTTTPGTITVTASSTDLEPGVVDVITGGKIYLSASLVKVPKNETSTITVTTRDLNGTLINYNGTINFEVDDSGGGSGNLSPYSITFSEGSSSGTVTFTAISSEGTVNITAKDSAPDILTDSDVLTLTTTGELVPHHIEVYAIPSSIPAGGTVTSKITAKVMTENNITVTSYIETVSFETTAGVFDSVDTKFTKGIATAVLSALTSPEATATITVSSGSLITGSTQVGFHIGPDHILLNAVPQKLSAGGQSCILTAKIVDYYGNVVSDYNQDITFIISPWPPGPIKFAKATTYILTQKVKKGISTVILKSGDDAGTAVIDAYSGDVSGTLNIPVDITLDLVNSETSPSYDSTEKIVSFDITIGGDPLTLEEMKVFWKTIGVPPETLDKIEIKSPSTEDFIIVYDTNADFPDSPASSEELIDVTDTTLSMGTSTIVMYFSGDIFDKTTLDVTFNPNSGDYLLHLKP